MVRDGFNSGTFLFLRKIVQEEVYQDCIDCCIRMMSQDLLTNKLNRPDTAAAKLDLPFVTRFYDRFRSQSVEQRRAVRKNAQ